MVGPVAGVIRISPELVQAAVAQNSTESMSDAVSQAVLQQEQAGGRGGGGGHGPHKAAMDAITRIAAGVDAKPKQRVKSPAERQLEIEKLKRERAERGERDMADDQEDDRRAPYQKNPLLSLF